MNRLIEQLGVAETFNISANLKVEELTNHDMIYVYHHLSTGDLVNLKFRDSDIKGNPRYDVYYQNYHLGAVLLSGIIRSFYEGERSITAEISSLSRDKFFPIKELDIRLGVSALKKVG